MATATSTQGEPLKAVRIALNLVKADHALQPRVAMDDEHWNRMARSYVEGDDVPPPIHLYYDGNFYWLVDGFHRYKAAWSLWHMGAKFQHIRAYVHTGTKREAIVFAAQANLDSRSKPMTDLDRKKAMWMLMDLPEWQRKTPNMLGKLVGFAPSTSRKHWLEYFHSRGITAPDSCETSDGRMQPVSARHSRSKELPRITCLRKRGFRATMEGVTIYLGKDPAASENRLRELHEVAETRRIFYEKSHRIDSYLVTKTISSKAIDWPVKCNGLFGRTARGVTFTWDPFRGQSGMVEAIGRAICCRLVSGTDRVVILCPVEAGTPAIMELGRKAGVEFMTIEDFVEILKSEPNS